LAAASNESWQWRLERPGNEANISTPSGHNIIAMKDWFL